MQKPTPGFTIVELLIVIVVIGILAAISIVAYNGIQNRANDTSVKNDLKSLSKIFELYKADNGRYQTAGGQLIKAQEALVYLAKLPTPPVHAPSKT